MNLLLRKEQLDKNLRNHYRHIFMASYDQKRLTGIHKPNLFKNENKKSSSQLYRDSLVQEAKHNPISKIKLNELCLNLTRGS